jgi:hypothetical protein
MSAGAGIALAASADQLGLTVEIIGTPGEEGGGGKIELLERGAFAGPARRGNRSRVDRDRRRRRAFVSYRMPEMLRLRAPA